MKKHFRGLLIIGLVVFVNTLAAQVNDGIASNMLTFEEYLAYVKKYHPLIKQANLTLNIGEANLLRARGGFDPKIEVDYDRKKFKQIEYYDQLNTTFKIPTWYGIEFKANFEENSGEFLNPNLSVPDDGLYSAGVSFSLARGFLINERMASLKKARFFRNQTKADRNLLVNNLIFEASKAYFQWTEAYNEEQIYIAFLNNASTRLEAVQKSVDAGDKPEIDITEARIAYQNRILSLEAATLKKRKAALEASNFLWLNDIPLEIEENIIPELPTEVIVRNSLFLEGITDTLALQQNHPKLQSLDAKIKGLKVEQKLKRNKLLPRIDLQYNFLTEQYDQLSSLNTANYKSAVNISFPLFLRKERGNLKLANYKLQDARFERMSESLKIQNKITAVNTEIRSLNEQNQLIEEIVSDYEKLVLAEERKFFLGESSLFLINSREQKLIDSRLKANKLSIKLLQANTSLYNSLGLVN
ncbi:TolC family protein [Spongiivirga citrea]|uniref:TolC family protein n=1 Tax=Spongiivirga citrea TaxID=1481457 RepID=A0A6M0CG86_9FLAO|nr:TolC family protein [Spongiivirga citrea]NER16865.1 TolC family protein [Spongiivirga citrea]